MAVRLPESPAAFSEAVWDDIRPYYEELVERPLDRGNVEEWLSDWSQLDSLLSEASALASFAYTCDTADPEREAAQLRLGSEIGPKAHHKRSLLQRRLVDLDYVRPGLETMVQRFANQSEIFREANVPLFAQLSKLATEWSKVNGALTVDWNGDEKTPAQLLPYLESADRLERERAFKLRAQAYLLKRDVLVRLFDRMYDLRQEVAHNAGFANYRDFAHREKNRFDYTPDDCLRFHAAVEESVLPAVERILERRRGHIGLDRLRPWDLAVDPKARAPLKPYESIDDFIGRAGGVYANITPDFRGYFERMAGAGLLDLDNRKGKAPGGFCDSLPYSKLPLIFMNAVAIDEDLRTLLHESGHAFHVFESAHLPLIFQR